MIIGMDFGTTNSGMSVYDGQHLRLIPLDAASQNATIARTALYVTNDRQVYIGREAIDTYYTQNLNRPVLIEKVIVGEIEQTFAELPTFRKYVYIEKDMLEPGRLFLSFKMGLPSLNYLGTVVGSHFYFLEDIIALYLYIARRRAEAELQTDVRRIVLGRPVRYSFDAEADRLAQERMLKAAFRAGFEEVYLQYEPIAAAHHYESTITGEQNVLIFDFGGGTLDISIVRVGNPKTRRVLANGGVPIAGDIFDQKLVRAKLPPHFGEGSFYRDGDKRLPVPSSFYEAFSNWQDMLALQRPSFLESIKRIEQGAQRPRQIRALRQLISTNYGLKVFDIVEGVKRELSTSPQAVIKLDGDGFTVREMVTRAEFERIIRADIQEISAYLDALLAQAGLRSGDIDAVIRTGGSSQIPAFVEMLESRFGAEKVRSLDIFSSVTSGLGIIAHRIERGEVDAPIHRARDYEHATNKARDGVPAIDFEVMKKYIAFTETETAPLSPTIGLVARLHNHDITAALCDDPALLTTSTAAELPLADTQDVITARADEPLLLATSDYRFTLKTPRQLYSLRELGLSLAETEGFYKDDFGDEHVTGIMNWGRFAAREWALLISTGGYYKVFQAEPLRARIEQPVPYHIPRLRGNPVCFIERPATGEIVLFSASGRAVRVASHLLEPLEGRAMAVSPGDAVIAAFTLDQPQPFLTATPDGHLGCLDSAAIANAQSLSSGGLKITTRRAIASVIPMHGSLYSVTSQRILPITDTDLEKGKLKLKKGETLVSLFSV